MPTYLECKEVSGTSGSVDATFNRTYTRRFRVIVDDPAAGPFFAGSHPDLPLIYSRHPEDPYAFCVGLVPSRDMDDMTVWHVACTYAYNVDSAVPLASPGGGSSSSSSGNPATDSQNRGLPPAERKVDPLERKHDYSYSTVKIKTVPIDEEPYALTPPHDNLRKICNTAGDPFIDQPSRDIHALQIVIGLNSHVIPDQVWLNRIGTLNQNEVTVDGVKYGPRELRLEGWSAQRVFENDTSYLRWSITLTQRPHWRVELRNSGNRAAWFPRDENGGLIGFDPPTIRAPRPEENIPLPMDLNLFGEYMPPKKVGNAFVSDPYYLEFNVFPETTWPTPL